MHSSVFRQIHWHCSECSRGGRGRFPLDPCEYDGSCADFCGAPVSGTGKRWTTAQAYPGNRRMHITRTAGILCCIAVCIFCWFCLSLLVSSFPERPGVPQNIPFLNNHEPYTRLLAERSRGSRFAPLDAFGQVLLSPVAPSSVSTRTSEYKDVLGPKAPASRDGRCASSAKPVAAWAPEGVRPDGPRSAAT